MTDSARATSPVAAPLSPDVRYDDVNQTTENWAIGFVALLAVVAFLIFRAIWKSARKVSVEDVARTAGAFTSAAERGYKQGRLGDR